MVFGERIKQKVHAQHKAPMVRAFYLCVVILLMSMAKHAAMAQNVKAFGIIRGTAFDASTKTPIPGVIINYVGPADVKGKVTTNEKGNYKLIGLLPGSYVLSAEGKGYRSGGNLRVIVAAGTDTVLEIKMFKAEFNNPFVRDMLLLLKMKANPEESPLACALLVAITIADDNEKTKVFADIAVEYAKAGQYDQAILITKTIEDADYNGRPLAYIAVEYAKTGQYDQATEVANTIVNDYKGWPLAYIAVEYAQAGQYDRAILLTKAIKDTFHRAWALAEMVAMYAKAGQYDEAIQLAQTIDKAPLLSPLWGDASFHKALALAEIAARFVEAGQNDKAFQLLSQAIQVAKTIEDTYYESLALAEIAGKYANVGQYDQAIQLVQTIGDAYSKARALAEIAARYEDRFNNPLTPFGRGDVNQVEAGQNDNASQLLSQAIQIAQTIEDAYSKAGVLAEIAGKYASTGQEDKVSQVLSQALQVAKTIGASFEGSGFISVPKAWGLAEVAGKYVEVGQYDDAIQIAKTVENPFQKSWTLAGIAGKCAETGQKGKVSQVLSQAIQAAQAIENANYKARALAEIGGKYAKAGQKVDDKAKKILQEIIRELE
ncbi:hypothetical protein FJZ31_14450 [Candidatus Poribacteria bacterium]|nr:hypothetical protein [Candidatus Poribacteria bacterium]